MPRIQTSRIVTLTTAAGLVMAPALAFAAQPSVPDTTVGKAGAALHDVVQLQQKYRGQIESATPEQKKGISEQANAQAVQAIQSHGLSVEEYSQVIRTAQNDPQLRQRLLQAAGKGD